MSETPRGLALLREAFPEHQISYLPKGGAKLAYVGHAALTDRLLQADPAWSWEPLACDERGLPALDEAGGLWIRLTVCGVTRLGYGDAGQKKGGDAMKERIGDALRNAAMRFGAALDLWHKGDLHKDEDEAPVAPEGYEAFVAELHQAAARGTDALKAAWVGAASGLRAHMTTVDAAGWAALKARAGTAAA